MTQKELMIGDWVSYKGKMPCKITAICKDTAVVDNDTTQDWRIDYDKLTPISLTAEILGKNFNSIENLPYGCRYYYYTDYTEVEITDYTDSIWKIDVDVKMSCLPIQEMYVNYVHELQHALRLCNIEKDIEI